MQKNQSAGEARPSRWRGPVVGLVLIAIGGGVALVALWPIDAVESFWRDHLVTQAAKRVATHHGCDAIDVRCHGYACYGPCVTHCSVDCRGAAPRRYKCGVPDAPLRPPWEARASAACTRTK